MSYEISRHQDFDVSIKRLAKRYRIALLSIYDKSEASTVKLNVIKEMARNLGFDV